MLFGASINKAALCHDPIDGTGQSNTANDSTILNEDDQDMYHDYEGHHIDYKLMYLWNVVKHSFHILE
jgi:hypothetical protein